MWLEPDLAVHAVLPGGPIEDRRTLPPPALVIEILSPSTRMADRHRKRPAYLAHGTGEVWLVDSESRTVERWTAASQFPELRRDTLVWSPAGATKALHVELMELFGPA